MGYHGWTHPFDAKGRRRDYADLPATIEDMQDDPYRSLAGELRNIGGFAKDSTPYSEFVWADFLRLRIKPRAVKSDFPAALGVALDSGEIRRGQLFARLVRPSREGRQDGETRREARQSEENETRQGRQICVERQLGRGFERH